MTRPSAFKNTSLLGGLAALLALPVPVLAEIDLSQIALEEVIVTARKREQTLQDVSVAVTALSSGAISDAHISTSEDLTFLVPSLNMQKAGNPRNSSFNIRGIGTQSVSTAAEPSVSTMLDGVVMGRSGQAFMQLLDVQRVEVLRGPQGTLFGKNSTGGVVHIITQNPTEEFSGEVSATAVDDDEIRGGFTVSGPITDALGFRLSAFASDMDGYIHDYYDGDDYNGSDEWSVRGKLRWTVADNLELKWASDYSDRDCDCTERPIRSLEPFGGNDAYVQGVLDDLDPVVPGDENDEVNTDRSPSNSSESWGHALEANWDIGEFTLTSITAYREFEIETGAGDLDSQPTTVFAPLQAGQTEQNQFTQEIRLASPVEGRLDYVLGFYYFDQDIDREFSREFEIFQNRGVATFDSEMDNWALFGEANYELADRWRLVLGARYTEDEVEFNFSRTREGIPSGLPDPVEPTQGDTDEDDLSGKIAVEWDFSDSSMSYLSYTEGYKGPAFDLNFGANVEDAQRIDPEVSESWELGLKGSYFKDRLQLGVALFHSEYDDFQSQAFFDPDGDPGCPPDNPTCAPDDDPPSFILINAGEVSTEGIEVDFVALPLPQLRLTGGFAIIDAKIDDYPDAGCSGGQEFRGECPDRTQDISGGDLPFSPDWKVSLQADYTVEYDNGLDLVLRAAMRAQDDILYGLHQDPNTIEDGYATYDASVKLRDQADRWDVTLFVKNLTDEFNVSSIISENQRLLQNGYTHILPRTYERRIGLEARYRW